MQIEDFEMIFEIDCTENRASRSTHPIYLVKSLDLVSDAHHDVFYSHYHGDSHCHDDRYSDCDDLHHHVFFVCSIDDSYHHT